MTTNHNQQTAMRYEVVGRTSTGIYAEVVEAESAEAALRAGRPLVRRLAAWAQRPIISWSVREG